MANVDRANGFRPAKSLIGAPWQSLVRFYDAGDRSSDTTNNHGDIYVGDPVKLDASGGVVPANSGDTILGVAVAVGKQSSTFGETGYFNPDDLGQRYLSFDEDGVVGVVPAEAALFEAQTATDLDLDIGDVVDINLTAATAHGDRVTGFSNVEIVADTNSDVKVVEHVASPDNDISEANARHLFKFQTTENSI